MMVLVRLKEGVDAGGYERWVLDSYAPAARRLGSVPDWRNHRVSGQLGSDAPTPHQYVVTPQVGGMEPLAGNMSGGEMQRLISGLHGYAEAPQPLAARFA